MQRKEESVAGEKLRVETQNEGKGDAGLGPQQALKDARKTDMFLSLPWQQCMSRSIVGKLCRQPP
jgi:hypothetical protein